MTRKIIQFQVIPETDHMNFSVYALCDDGTIWATFKDHSEWVQMDQIPQQELNEDKQITQNPQPDPSEYASWL